MDVKSLVECVEPLDIQSSPAHKQELKEYFSYFNINFEDKLEGVDHYFGYLNTDTFDVACHYYTVANAKASCFIVHGLYDHTGLYGNLIEYCLKRQLNVIIFDLPGHGLSSGDRASINDFSHYQSVFKCVTRYFSGNLTEPLYLMGQSTGGAIIMEYLLSSADNKFSKVVLLAPLFKPTGWRNIVFLYNVFNQFLRFIPRRFSKNTSNNKFLNFVKNEDPFHARFTDAHWLGALKTWIEHFSQLKPSQFKTLVLQGTADETVDWIVNVPVVEAKFPNAQVYYLEGAGHHLVNESEDFLQVIFSEVDNYLDS